MRTIKFRGKCAKDSRYSGEWVYGACVQCEKSNDVLIIYAINDRNSCSYHVDPDTVGQFTGLYDKNGEEIYEGDILQWGEGDYKIKQVVMFLHGAFGYKCDPYTFVSYVGNTNFNFWAKGTDSRFEIIGNIHDNPDLLKGYDNKMV